MHQGLARMAGNVWITGLITSVSAQMDTVEGIAKKVGVILRKESCYCFASIPVVAQKNERFLN